MISLQPPGSDHIGRLFERLADAPFSYPEVGATRAELPSGYNVDRYSAELGQGHAVFEAAREDIRDWVPFQIPWLRFYPQAPPAPDVLAAVMVRAAGLWWTNVSRVIYTLDEPHVFGFAYGTLRHHAEMGEESFRVEYSEADAKVTYRVLAFSRPRHALARLGYPLTRAVQRRFGADSSAAMQRRTSSS